MKIKKTNEKKFKKMTIKKIRQSATANIRCRRRMKRNRRWSVVHLCTHREREREREKHDAEGLIDSTLQFCYLGPRVETNVLIGNPSRAREREKGGGGSSLFS